MLDEAAITQWLEQNAPAKVAEAATVLAEEIRSQWPSKSGYTKGTVRVEDTDDPLRKQVVVGFPGWFIERGFVDRAGKFHSGRFIAQNALQRLAPRLAEIMTPDNA